MMIKPGITELDRCVDSRYTLVSMVAKRARMIGEERLEAAADGEPSYDPSLDKAVTQAVKEISDGIVGYVRSEAIERAKEYEQEKFDKISQFEKEKTAEEETDSSDNTEKPNANDEALSAAMAENETDF